jgi:hypothetical protein
MYQPPAGRLLEFYESDSSVKYDEDTGDEDRVAMPGRPRMVVALRRHGAGPGRWWGSSQLPLLLLLLFLRSRL